MRVKIVHPATTRRKKIKPDRRSTCRASADLRPQKNMRDVLRDARLRLRAHTHTLHLHTNSGNKATRKKEWLFFGFYLWLFWCLLTWAGVHNREELVWDFSVGVFVTVVSVDVIEGWCAGCVWIFECIVTCNLTKRVYKNSYIRIRITHTYMLTYTWMHTFLFFWFPSTLLIF